MYADSVFVCGVCVTTTRCSPLVVVVARGRRCANEDADLARLGTGTCDYACAGDSTQVCGGYYAFTAYEVGEHGDAMTHKYNRPE